MKLLINNVTHNLVFSVFTKLNFQSLEHYFINSDRINLMKNAIAFGSQKNNIYIFFSLISIMGHAHKKQYFY